MNIEIAWAMAMDVRASVFMPENHSLLMGVAKKRWVLKSKLGSSFKGLYKELIFFCTGPLNIF